MKKTNMIWGLAPLALAALLATGCTKDADVPGMRIVEEGMATGQGSKVIVDVDNPTVNSWVAGESVGWFNGSEYGEWGIQQNGSNYYYVANDRTSCSLALWYPSGLGTYYANGNTEKVKFTSFPTSLNYSNRTQPSIQFPMAAFGESSDESAMFRHACGALCFNVVNNTGSDTTIGKVTIVLMRGGNTISIWPRSSGYAMTFDKDGTITPASMSNYSHSYDLTSLGTLAAGSLFRAILPVPVYSSSLDYTIRFYDDSDNLIKERTISGLTIERNNMYNLKDFNLKD